VALSDRFDWITELAATFYQGGDSDRDDAYDLATGGRYWIGEERRWAVNFALRTELSQLSDTDEHCPIGGLIGLTLMPRLMTPEQIADRIADREAGDPPGTAKAAAAAAAAEEQRSAAEKAAAAKAAAEKSAADQAAAKKATDEAAAKRAAEQSARQAADEAARQAAAEAARQAPTETINFGSGSDRLTNIAKAKLDEVALRLKQNPAATALIIGGADAQGSDGSNQSLGTRRAQSAKSYLVSRHQIDGSRITVESRGSSDPAASNDTEAGREQNRRAVIIVRL
jgi:outer membrane protein OmpA-like peptidoglycan-associated protein